MATKVSKVSDLDGAIDADYGVVVRGYPGVEGAKLLDVTASQADDLLGRAVKNTVTVEVRKPDTTVQAVQVSKAELDKWVGKPEVIQNAAHLKGRRPGYSPTGNGGNGGY